MCSHRMKYFIAVTVLSCLWVNKADAAASISQSKLAIPSVTVEIAVPALSQDYIQSLPSIGFAIEVPAKEEKDENPPVLPVVTNVTYDKDVDLPVFSQREPLKGGKLSPVAQVTSCRSEGQIAITFSEGPSNTTAGIARQLNNAQTRANFFVNILMLKDQRYGTVLQHIYNAGHFIGMTYRLPAEDPQTMSDQDIKADIIQSAHEIESLIHVAPKYVRLHLSALNDGRTERILHDLGFVLVGYNLDGKDYVHKTPGLVEQEYRHTFEQYQKVNDEKKGSFISIQYDIPSTSSLEAVLYVIKLVQDEGYTAVRMDGCLNDPKPYKVSAAGLEYVGDKFSYGTPGYKSGQRVATGIISNASAEEEEGVRGLTADDAFLITSSSVVGPVSLSRLGYVLMPALVYAVSTMM